MSDNSLLVKTPPHDIEAEKALLGSILLNNDIVDDVADKIKVTFFYDQRHQVLFSLILELWSNNHPIDIIYILNLIEKSDKTKVLGENEKIDKDYLLELISKSSLTNSPQSLSSIIKNKFLLRTIVTTSDKMRSLALDNSTDPNEILDEAQKKLYEVSLENIDKNFVSLSEILTGAFERISELYNNKTENRGVSSGFTDIDKKLGGFHKSDLIILAARPSMGKTALALEFARRVAFNKEKPTGVAIFSLEMSRDQLVDRLLSVTSGVDSWKIRTGKFSDESDDFTKLGNAIGLLDQAPVWIDDNGGLTVLELRSKARRLKARHNIGLIIVDYLQLMSGGVGNKYSGNRVQEVSDISRGLKLLAKELDIPVIALSQLSRGVEGRDDKRPMLSDLRESGSIEQDADVVMFVHREEMYKRDDPKVKGKADILISKHRNGQVGAVELAWVDKIASFDNLDGGRIRRSVGE